MSWILVLTVFYQTPSVTVSPGLYSTRDACVGAARAFAGEETSLVGVTLEAHCIPGPNLVLAPPTRRR